MVTSQRIRYVPAIGPRLRILLFVVFALFALLGVNSVYLASVTFLEWLTDKVIQDYFEKNKSPVCCSKSLNFI